jgi:nucleoid DNA-binding protein
MAQLITKQDFIKALAEKTGLSKNKTEVLFNEWVQFISQNLQQGNSVRLPDLGTLKPTERKARNGRNPKTGENMLIPAKKSIAFTVAKSLKDILNNGK